MNRTILAVNMSLQLKKKNLPANKTLGSGSFIGEVHQTFTEELITNYPSQTIPKK